MQTKNLLQIFLIISGILFITACEKVEDPFPVNIGQSIFYQNTEYVVDKEFELGNSTQLVEFLDQYSWTEENCPDNRNERFVVLEEFTGHKCKFCPNGTREILRLDTIFKEKLIPVAIHAGSFASVNPPIAEKYTTDFKVKGGHGGEYLNTFGVSSYPSGLVSRVNGAQIFSDAQWEQQINNITSTTPIAQLLVTNYYEPNERILRTQIDIEWLSSSSEEFNLQLYLAEDHIIDWQLDGNTDVEFYDHRHVLRKVVNGTWGKSIGQAVEGETTSIQYVTTVNEEWKANDMESIAFIFNSSNYEIMQANAAYIHKP
ncbi:MAG: Omp28 family outer membrane lipoprotein [Vicingaceae bacterium]